MAKLSLEELTGKTESHLVEGWDGAKVCRNVVVPLQRLGESAKEAGFDLAIASSFRDYDRQKAIWKNKLSGRRPVLDHEGNTAVDISGQTDSESLFTVMRWSALPGLSRHHWGTDFDVYDRAAVSADYQLQLIPAEYAEGGPFYGFYCWLRQFLQSSSRDDFYWPYDKDCGAIGPEPWHISYRPLAEQCVCRVKDPAILEWLLADPDFPLSETVALHYGDIAARYLSV